jgi:hypothetical protein
VLFAQAPADYRVTEILRICFIRDDDRNRGHGRATGRQRDTLCR